MNIPTTDLKEWVKENTYSLTATTIITDDEAYRGYDPQGAFNYAREKLVRMIADELLSRDLVTFKQYRSALDFGNCIEVSCHILKPRVKRNA